MPHRICSRRGRSAPFFVGIHAGSPAERQQVGTLLRNAGYKIHVGPSTSKASGTNDFMYATYGEASGVRPFARPS